MENINLKLENFEGPFDLLLKLIKVNKMEISEISIYDITNQYIQVLHKMEELDLEIASEFFVMASTLIEIKSKDLLPRKKEEEEEIPQKELLLRKLKEYEFYKNAAYELLKRYDSEQVIVRKLPDTIEEEDLPLNSLLNGVTSFKLFSIYMDILDRQKEKTNTITVIDKKIKIDSYKIEDKMDQLVDILNKKRILKFSDIGNYSESRAEVIVFFLAVLELARNYSVKIIENVENNDFILELRR